MQIRFSALAPRKSVHITVLSPADRIVAIPCSNKDLAKAHNANNVEGLEQYPALLERRPDWLVTMWSAANVRVPWASTRPSRHMTTLRSAGDKYDQYSWSC